MYSGKEKQESARARVQRKGSTGERESEGTAERRDRRARERAYSGKERQEITLTYDQRLLLERDRERQTDRERSP